MKVGLFFGSFNPIHLGHTEIIRYFSRQNIFGQIWVVVSPLNPFKKENDLIGGHHRLNMVRQAVKEMNHVMVCDIEFQLPTPSYTYKSLKALSKSYPDHHFELILGSDAVASLPLWKNHTEIIDHYHIHIFPRKNDGEKTLQTIKSTHYPVKKINLSSSMIRNRMKAKKSIKAMVCQDVWRYGESAGFFYK